MPNYNISVSTEELKSIQARTLLVHGDQDPATPIECIAKAKQNLPNSFLWVQPNVAHSAHDDKSKSEFIRISKEFLTGSWQK